MSLKERSFLTTDDLSTSETEAVFSLADEMESGSRAYSELCKGLVMASLFYEPSTRTRLSFETAMHKLGGSVVTAADVSTSSIVKGESLADTARIVGSYVDLIVVRHPWEGAARAMSNYAGVPVINAGDGSHEHPTQTLCDLYTLRREKGTIEDLTVAVCGDLKSGRAAHSLIYALARFGANIVFISTKGYELPEYVKEKLRREYIGTIEEGADIASNSLEEAELGGLDAIYQTPDRSHTLAMLPEVNIEVKLAGTDALYATRLQRERHGENEQSEDSYFKLDRKMMTRPEFKNTLVMHPLPRVDEIAHELDEDPRSMYFKQAAYGVPIRMALLALTLGTQNPSIKETPNRFVKPAEYPVYKNAEGIRCTNQNCVTNHETTYATPEFLLTSDKPAVLRCVYCSWGSRPESAGSSKTRVFHRADRFTARRLVKNNIVFFESPEQALDRGFRPGYKESRRSSAE